MIATPWHATDGYTAYIQAQIIKTTKLKGVYQPRIARLVGQLVRADRKSPLGRRVLAVGCRSGIELDILSAAGFEPTGIDLVGGGRVQQMDMHALTVPDNSFDVIFSCHSLEHAYDVTQVLQEWARVTTPGGTWAIEVPIRFRPTEVDRQDFGSVHGLQQACLPYLQRVYLAEESADHSVARLIAEVR